ncbi:venom metalloproteinase BumaMPs1-like isoform X2 [Ornithodoros turicata]|uniref:venom metalloproteinase BumaMPs1-like isoform X2 n=1 Tax=Ornithodoros turicata TaxID=34597 RepID=UPI003139DF07
MWNCESSWLVMVFINSAVSLPLGETIVYPKFIESRSTSGQKILKITDDLVLALEHRPAFEDQFTVTTVDEDGTEIHSIERGRDYNEEFFVDRTQQASVRISQDNGLEVHGIIGEAVRIEPISVRSRSSRGQVAHLLIHERLKDMPRHLNYADTPPLNTTIESPASTENLTDTSLLNTTIESPASTEDLNKQSDENISPEIHLVIDSALYRGFHNSTTKIFQYYGVVLNAVNLRLETITLLQVEARITGFTIHTDFTEPYFDYRRYDETTFISDLGTLQRFNQYYKINRTDAYNSSDVIFLITGQDVAFIHENILFKHAEGATYVGSACGNNKVGFCEDTAGSFDVVHRLSHEMGHSLGCTHDGAVSATNIPNHPNATSCKWASGFLMTYVQEGLNQYRFSNCCANQMLYVSRLPRYQCLKDHTEASTTIASPKVLPGSNTSLDEQCRHRHSKSHYDTYRALTGCQLACVIPADEWNDRYYTWIRALDGTPCDSNNTSMVCIRGECVSGPDYPYNSEVIPPFRSTTPRPPITIRTTTMATKTNTAKKSWFQRAIDWCKRTFGKSVYGVPLTPRQRIFSLTHGSSGSKSS